MTATSVVDLIGLYGVRLAIVTVLFIVLLGGVACDDFGTITQSNEPAIDESERLSFSDYASPRCAITTVGWLISTWGEVRDFYPDAIRQIKASPPPRELQEWHDASIVYYEELLRRSYIEDPSRRVPDWFIDDGSDFGKALIKYDASIRSLSTQALQRLTEDYGCRFS